ncbi:hypothetical protein [Flavivirga rizhaonensis]|uniref:Glycine dehydrogenase n=1 Tax=Flavivirga rizhaonensis TaxID=2559571 RepID=A0A4S1DV82_9FLAO|nr:hypothetical protein [Flavivirga rizhaonensis]TGV02010.1 hypothetical protein EM932_12565 [Flavivirga rizhaonensis]
MSKIKIFIPCDDANHVCDKTQYKEASLWEMIKLNIHLIYCRACRKYTNNNTKLTKAIKESNVECLDKKSKESMKLDFEKALKELTD